MANANLLLDLDQRGMVQDTTDRGSLEDLLSTESITLYHGIDPSAPSLHIGNFIGVLMLRRFQEAGHKPIVLVGGSTGMIGDPGGRSEERNLLDEETLARNLAGIRKQLEALVDLERAELVNNYEWTKSVNILDFLRDVGKHATVNQMVAKDSVRTRMEGKHGISYTEFSYMLLQAFDFWWLHNEYNCQLQIGGSDQWGNIAQGVDLIRRRNGNAVHGLTWPLITRSDGQKYGKSVDGAIWLDPEMTLPYEFHQYWLSVDDRDVQRFLMQLTLLNLKEIEEIVIEHQKAPDKRHGQQRIADEVTALVHGTEAVDQAKLAATALFGSGELNEEMLAALEGIIPKTSVKRSVFTRDETLIDLLVDSGLTASKSEARRLLKQGGVSVNREKRSSGDLDMDALIGGRFLLLQKGKKQRNLVILDD
ncbi:MAG: tyrosine--tRNA ligase [Acidimicrobiaceae bacterium]|jgi:tyrosyl-tRNA synthetase|nr:tyrosine--tRNA ligase [Acidimicrobiaceae bacterium]MBO00176.1 tyrosine--tRNA ligase [Acidimicrobiaceae bacterium]HAY51577.1 tyrosine--tRNA ligase [Acidimicrobiaceae bacterium]|tara:strand:+ start:14253 stop:15515 length:1263 start_codon:yes stop_codon:yes gene_type:complete